MKISVNFVSLVCLLVLVETNTASDEPHATHELTSHVWCLSTIERSMIVKGDATKHSLSGKKGEREVLRTTKDYGKRADIVTNLFEKVE